MATPVQHSIRAPAARHPADFAMTAVIAVMLAAASSLPARAAQTALVFSPYKDVTINIDPRSHVMQTAVTGRLTPMVGPGSVVAADAPGLKAITLAFATGTCGDETWGHVPGQAFADANVPKLAAARMGYILSTGGAEGTFHCASARGMRAFIRRYLSPQLVGIDFDIEHGQTWADVDALVAQVAAAEKEFPRLRFSFTLATWAASDGSHKGLNALSTMVVDAVRYHRLRHYSIDLMVMDYGHVGPDVCVVAGDHCDMGKSAIQAVENLVHTYGIPRGHIGLTPMIGANDNPHQVFTLDDVDVLAGYAVRNGLAGVHFWALDRDAPCDSPHPENTCNSVPTTIPLAYTRRFLHGLGD